MADELLWLKSRSGRRVSKENNVLKVRCPICGTSCLWQDNPWRPFCSERCRLLDLGNWAAGDYRIAGAAASPIEDEEEEL
ncbi:MAG: DNA gyrase inhibitor YacG [Desulfuromonas thiophila]|jgi:endogenous inhibitor of DNA gyrase (YacG/DUF329 family)|nr:DNA gyrase inhibitor YacG [Desulfuromonas thiophila]